EELAFRAEVRAFVEQKLPADVKRKVDGGIHLDRDDYLGWHQ
ncbi:MAG: pimeloyl-CoA dehydrogenase large subunit, partial [Actinobacteria bacterium]|nr:pimeloyl-CoA dehydrogenase large subunit [Actinomycetota bacterium]NIS33564.1 pimeloyl-CoA dehydrogenase large subunit [Actinomycetota bacterium]NIU21739.1 pimeloyl-CoA dehydrogenase large subunit [Actinomycetota bacterium]NIU68436.1 pimeloyl-CoA dehydrogenase large subunit [Actinomycetota bacterium]NIV88640.1 pimeloyl-CoA dehydrogenase large subunit [Actinomycetota bacterium]